MGNAFFAMKNNHVKGCGEPINFTNDDPKKYYGYFENEYGEQWVFVYDQRTGDAELRGGDAGWGNTYKIKEGRNLDLILNESKKVWLHACWSAASAFPKE